MEYVGKVGETLDFVCRKDKKVFQTTEPDLEDNVLTIVCKPDKYYTVPSSGVSALHISQYEVVPLFCRTGQFVRHSVSLRRSNYPVMTQS